MKTPGCLARQRAPTHASTIVLQRPHPPRRCEISSPFKRPSRIRSPEVQHDQKSAVDLAGQHVSAPDIWVESSIHSHARQLPNIHAPKAPFVGSSLSRRRAFSAPRTAASSLHHITARRPRIWGRAARHSTRQTAARYSHPSITLIGSERRALSAIRIAAPILPDSTDPAPHITDGSPSLSGAPRRIKTQAAQRNQNSAADLARQHDPAPRINARVARPIPPLERNSPLTPPSSDRTAAGAGRSA